MQEKVSLYQVNPLNQWPDNNLEQIEAAVKEASASGSTLCVLPEDFLFGLVRGEDNLIEAGSQFEHWSSRLVDLASSYSIDLVPGSLPRLEGGLVYNTTLYIDKKGNTLGQYSKNNLWFTERGELTPSSVVPGVFDGALGKTSLLICWDVMDSELFRQVVRQGAEWVIIPSFWASKQSSQLKKERGEVDLKGQVPFIEGHMLNSLIATRAHEYGLGVVFCNFGGINTHIDRYGDRVEAPSAGASQIVAPLGRLKSRAKGFKEESLVVEVDSEKLVKAQKDHEVFYGRREDIISSYLSKERGKV